MIDYNHSNANAAERSQKNNRQTEIERVTDIISLLKLDLPTCMLLRTTRIPWQELPAELRHFKSRNVNLQTGARVVAIPPPNAKQFITNSTDFSAAGLMHQFLRHLERIFEFIHAMMKARSFVLSKKSKNRASTLNEFRSKLEELSGKDIKVNQKTEIAASLLRMLWYNPKTQDYTETFCFHQEKMNIDDWRDFKAEFERTTHKVILFVSSQTVLSSNTTRSTSLFNMDRLSVFSFAEAFIIYDGTKIIPTHTKIPHEQVRELFAVSHLSISSLPILFADDAVAKYMNYVDGDVIEIRTPTPSGVVKTLWHVRNRSKSWVSSES